MSKSRVTCWSWKSFNGWMNKQKYGVRNKDVFRYYGDPDERLRNHPYVFF